MKKEEILEKSRQENKNKDVYGLEVEAKGARIAGAASMILTTIYYLYELISGKGENPALYSIITAYLTVTYAYKAAKIEENRKLNVSTSIIWGLVSILFILNYFKVI